MYPTQVTASFAGTDPGVFYTTQWTDSGKNRCNCKSGAARNRCQHIDWIVRQMEGPRRVPESAEHTDRPSVPAEAAFSGVWPNPITDQ